MIQWLIQLVQRSGFKLDLLNEGIRLIIQMLRSLLEGQSRIEALARDNNDLLKSNAEAIQAFAAALAPLGVTVIDIDKKVTDILAGQTSQPPVKFTITLIGGSTMATASVDFQLLDNAVAKAIATASDAAGLPAKLPEGVVPSWSSSDPGLTVAPDASDPSGLTAIVTPAQPPVLVTGAVITISATLADGSSVTGQSQPIDVVGGPAVGFKISLS